MKALPVKPSLVTYVSCPFGNCKSMKEHVMGLRQIIDITSH
jgi:hypothetical protein